MLIQAIHNYDMSPAAIFVNILESIKVNAVVPTTTTTTVEEDTGASTRTSSSTSCTDRTPPSTITTPAAIDTEDEILIKMGKPYTQVLLLLWALHHLEAEVKPPTIATL